MPPPRGRRAVLSGLAASAFLGPPVGPPVGLPASAAPAPEIPADFLGLSYETAALVPGTLLSPDNHALVSLIRRLGPHGVLRLGGNSSDRPRAHPGPAAIARLAGFLRATGWSLIHGLDLGTGTPQEAAQEAAAVAEAAGPALIAFQIGNEPDIFPRSLRPLGWSVPDYLREWRRFAEAVRARVPAARFAGPDIAADGSWMMPFALAADPRPVLLTRHFYAEGPASSPAVTIPRLLASGPRLAAAMAPAARAARATGLPLRMTETNSVYAGGRAGVSDTLAAAAWGAELMFRLAAAGWRGVNFHTVPSRPYTPLGEETGPRPIARPLYYAMLLFARSAPRRVSPLSFPALASYAIEGRDGRRRLALINMSPERTARVALAAAPDASLLRLAAASPAATSGITLGGAEIANDGTWRPRPERPAAHGAIDLPPCNAVLITTA
ncbi:MAG TPA: glycosyl hydrolase family 79 C-terminal domain-containing protein [Acetobacteraceae bacterium]|nr:glycosyl hydrolase family 79 C-terminal domain-containing protein [Acetobacteraceae bacterium]